MISMLLAAALAAWPLASADRTMLVDRSPAGHAFALGSSGPPSVSPDGRWVAFTADGSVWLRDVRASRSVLMSATPDGHPSDRGSFTPKVSAGGRRVVFVALGDDLTPERTPGVVLRDRLAARTVYVSRDPAGRQQPSATDPDITADGRFVAYSAAGPGSTSEGQVYVRDLAAGRTILASRRPDGRPGSGQSGRPAISDDGRTLVFESAAADLVPGDRNATTDIFVRDLPSGRTVRVSVGNDGREGRSVSLQPAISGDGSTVAFLSASSIGPGGGGCPVCVVDRRSGRVSRADVSSSGVAGNGFGEEPPSLSRDGRFVAFDSYAENLVPNDDNFGSDVFVRDRLQRTTRRVSVGGGPGPTQGFSSYASVSADGRRIGFLSTLPLVPDVGDQTAHIYLRLTGAP